MCYNKNIRPSTIKQITLIGEMGTGKNRKYLYIILLIFYFYFKIIIVRNIFFNSESGEKLYESHINYIGALK